MLFFFSFFQKRNEQMDTQISEQDN